MVFQPPVLSRQQLYLVVAEQPASAACGSCQSDMTIQAPYFGWQVRGVQKALVHVCDTCVCRMQIVVGRAHTVDGQMDLLMTVGAKMVEEPYKLLIVDSIMALFRCAAQHCAAQVAG